MPNAIKKIWEWFKKESDAAGENETLVTLIRVAQEDDEIKRTLKTILSLPSFHRKSMLNTMISEMKMNSAPGDFVAAITCLLDDDTAQKALEAISGYNSKYKGV